MMFLILKIFLYLCVALMMGGAAGWLLRHINAQKELEELQRNLADSKTKVPKLESLLRAKEERIRALSTAQSERDEASKGTRVQDEQAARALREKEMEVQRLKNRIEVLERAEGNEPLIAADSLVDAESSADDETVEQDVDNALISQLHQEIERLKEEVASTQIQLEVARSDKGMEKEVAELTTRLRQKAEDYERLQKSLQQEQRKVAELERERELQNRSLKVLHQQLEMVRDTGT